MSVVLATGDAQICSSFSLPEWAFLKFRAPWCKILSRIWEWRWKFIVSSVFYLYPVLVASIKYHVREFRLFQFAIAMDMNVKYTTNRTKYICQASKQRKQRGNKTEWKGMNTIFSGFGRRLLQYGPHSNIFCWWRIFNCRKLLHVWFCLQKAEFIIPSMAPVRNSTILCFDS